MESNYEFSFFTNILLLLVFSKIFGELFERWKQPAMIGEIIAGIILGPTIFNLVHKSTEIKAISEIGIFFLIIIAGLEIKVKDVIDSLRGKEVFISIMAFVLPILSGFLIGYFFKIDYLSTIFISLCIAITALPVSIRILMDIGILNTDIGKKIISVAIFDDVISFVILGLILNLNRANSSLQEIVNVSLSSLLKLSIFLLILFASYKFMNKSAKNENFTKWLFVKWLKNLKSKEARLTILIIFILSFAITTEYLGFHFIIGAFFAAMLLNENLIDQKNVELFKEKTNGITLGFLAPIFFAGIGLELNILSIKNYWLLFFILFASIFTKTIGGFIGSKIAGFTNKKSLTIGLGLNARGIMEIVIANIAYKSGFINVEIFSMLIIMGVFTTIFTPFLLKNAIRN